MHYMNHDFYDFIFLHVSVGVLLLISVVAALWSFLLISESSVEKIKSTVLLVAVIGSSFLGARVLHVLIERTSLLVAPQLIFSRFDGMTFNGSLLFGFLTFSLLILIFPKDVRFKYWDVAGLLIPFTYGILRVGCFVTGCCWGKISAVPWAVKYTASSVMPWLGLPVHPVQLYDALASFCLLAVLLFVHQTNRFRGRIFLLYLSAYSVQRYYIENFRGDAIRGENIIFGLSTSQVVSVVLFIGSVGVLNRIYISGMIQRFLKKANPSYFLPFIILLLSLQGCLPQPPDPDLFAKSNIVRTGLEYYQSNQSARLWRGLSQVRGNALFLTADATIYKALMPMLKNALTTDSPPSIDDLVWWQYAPILSQMYDQIIRITIPEAKSRTVIQALAELESLGKPFDVYLLSHGLPNHLSSGTGYFLSFRDLAKLKGRYQNLNLVFMQACFGSTLTDDWHNVGAKSVISFDGLNRNLLWLGFFIEWYRYYDVNTAANLVNQNMELHLGSAPLYRKLLLLAGASVNDYLQIPAPSVSPALASDPNQPTIEKGISIK